MEYQYNIKNCFFKEEVVIMKNKFGQPYECSLPKFDDHLDEEEDALNAKKEGPTYNFTEIDEKIENAMGKLAKSKTCIYRVIFKCYRI